MGGTYTTRYPNSIYFQNWYTPKLYELFPSSATKNVLLSLYGWHRLSDLGDGERDLGDVKELKYGNDLCSRFDSNQTELDSTDYLKCEKSSMQEAGKYNVSEKNNYGYANNSFAMRKSSWEEEYFEFLSVPSVSEVTPHQGNVGGQILTIKGTGFSTKKENNTIMVGMNTPCVPLEATAGEIKCRMEPLQEPVQTLPTDSTNQTGGFVSGSGLQYARYKVG